MEYSLKGKAMNFEDIQKQVERMMNERNSRPLPDFENYSPEEMNRILHFTFSLESPLQIQKLPAEDYMKIPILNMVKYLAKFIEKEGELKLTQKGFLPTKVVADLYKKGFLKDELIERRLVKLYKETDSIIVSITRILLEMSNLVKKRHGKLSLTKTGRKILENDEELFRTIFLTFTNRFNWAYFDRYGENQIGQLGYGFSLILLSKYGNQMRSGTFYAEKYLKAFPRLLDMIVDPYSSAEDIGASCYTIRVFERFLFFFGLINMEEQDRFFDREIKLEKSDLFDKLFYVRPPLNSR